MSAEAKARVLFVDDEPLVLNLLRQAVKMMHQDWEGVFASSGDEALKHMAAQPFDVIVSDMRMPGMSGAQLLNEVMRLYPATVRIVLSGYAEQETVLRCVGSTHQFLAKPVDFRALSAMLKRVTNLRQRLHSEEIRQLVGQKKSLPALPKVYFEILDALAEPDCSVERIGQIVATDPGLTAKLLQLVNSAFFGFAHEVSSAEEATVLLGTGTIRSLALSLHLFSAFEIPKTEGCSLEEIWSHSLRVARLAQRIAHLEGADETLLEEAFTSGLLHDIGKLLLADCPSTHYLDLFVQAHKENRSLLELETQALHATHAEVGAYLLDLWGLPLPLVEAVAWHHAPAQAGSAVFSALTAVHVANVLEHTGQANPAPANLNQLDQSYLEQLSLGNRVEAWQRELANV